MLRATAQTSELSPHGAVADAGEVGARSLLQSFWRSARGFWGPRGTRLAWVLSAALLAIILLNLAASYGMNVWHRVIFDALQASDSDTIESMTVISTVSRRP